MKRLSVATVALVLGLVAALTVGVSLASATPDEDGTVTFRGIVASDEQCGVFPVCYEQCFCPVNVTEVLDDPLGQLEGVSSVEVCYGYDPKGFEEGEAVEVYGFAFMGECPFQYCGRVLAECSPTVPDCPLYIVRLPAPTPTPSPPTGGTTLPTDKLGLLMPWIVAAGSLVVLGGLSLAVWSRRRGAERTTGC